MGFEQSRRDFLKKLSLISAGLLIVPSAIAKSLFTHEERILLGIEKPDDLSSGGFRLRKEAGEAFLDMQSAAEKEGIKLYSQSSYRSFNRQLGIWNRKYERYSTKKIKAKDIPKKIIEYSTIPGTSRHHWGTDLDIVDASMRLPSDPLLEKHYKEGGMYFKLYDWLKFNAHNFGFHEVYTKSEWRLGFEYEPWHWSYKALSKPMLEDYLKIDLKDFFEKSEILGHEYFSKDFLKKYKKENILDINPTLLPTQE